MRQVIFVLLAVLVGVGFFVAGSEVEHASGQQQAIPSSVPAAAALVLR